MVSPFPAGFAAVLFSAWFGGVGPGLVSTGLYGAAATYLFLHSGPPLAPDAVTAGRLGLFVATGMGLSGLMAGMVGVQKRRLATEELYHSLVWAAKDYSIILLDTGGHIASWNVGAERIKGYTADEILHRHFSCLYAPGDGQRERADATLRMVP